MRIKPNAILQYLLFGVRIMSPLTTVFSYSRGQKGNEEFEELQSQEPRQQRRQGKLTIDQSLAAIMKQVTSSSGTWDLAN